jgi:hypothetical protein
MTSILSRTNSAAFSGSRAARPSALRISSWMLTLGVAGVPQSVAQRLQEGLGRRRTLDEDTDQVQLRLLRTRGGRPKQRNRRGAGTEREEGPATYAITLSLLWGSCGCGGPTGQPDERAPLHGPSSPTFSVRPALAGRVSPHDDLNCSESRVRQLAAASPPAQRAAPKGQQTIGAGGRSALSFGVDHPAHHASEAA